MNAEDWKSVETKLCLSGSSVKLKADGYELTLIIIPYKSLKNCIAVYVNGSIKGEWVLNDCDIRRRFYCRHTRSLLTQKVKKRLKKESKAVREIVLSHPTEYDWFEPYWSSFRSLKSHLIKNNNSIEIIQEGENIE